MIRTYELIPEVYSNRSRDFQLLEHVIDVLFNYCKTSIDGIEATPMSDDLDSMFIDLLSLTLNFDKAHEYTVAQLKALCSTFIKAMRYKGTLQSIEMIANIVGSVEGITDKIYLFIDSEDSQNLKVFMPSSITRIQLFNDMLEYLLPAGMTCELTQQQTVDQSAEDVISTNDYLKKAYVHSANKSQIFKEEQASESGSDLGQIGRSFIDNATIVGYLDAIATEAMDAEDKPLEDI